MSQASEVERQRFREHRRYSARGTQAQADGRDSKKAEEVIPVSLDRKHQDQRTEPPGCYQRLLFCFNADLPIGVPRGHIPSCRFASRGTSRRLLC